MAGSNTTFVDEERELESGDPEEFDRIEFALGAVRALSATRITVAVFRNHSRLSVQVARDLRGREGARWVMLGVPPRASRAQIAVAVAALTGNGNAAELLQKLPSSAE